MTELMRAYQGTVVSSGMGEGMAVDMAELMEHAGQLSEVTKGMAQGDLAQALIRLHEENKDK